MQQSGAEAVKADPWALQDKRNVLEAEGVDIQWKYGWSFRVARYGGKWNKKFQEAGVRIYARSDVVQFQKRVSGRNYKSTDADMALFEKISMEVFVEGCLLGWKGVVKGGQPMEFNKANALMVLTTFPDLYDTLLEVAKDADTFEPEIIPGTEEVKGN